MLPRGTTPTYSLILNDNTIDLTVANNVYVSFKGQYGGIEKTGDDLVISAHQVDVYLNQAETLAFTEGEIEIQINWTYADGQRACTVIKKEKVGKNLIGRELE